MPTIEEQKKAASSRVYLRIKTMLSRTLGGCCPRRIIERIVGPVHEGVLTEHGSHDGTALWSQLRDAIS